jgi:hypothetical protein
VTIVDVGGDILAHGDEPTLRSPLADSLVLAATADIDDVRLIITGPGIDGELPESLILDRYEQLGAKLVHRLSVADVTDFRPLLEWHPSEATGLLCAAAAGTRGTAEIRDQGFPVSLSDRTPEVHAIPDGGAFTSNRIARELRRSSSLADVETTLRALGRESEIDYERRKAERGRVARAVPSRPSAPAFANELAEIREEAARRGVDFITLRGLAERLGIAGVSLVDLQRLLASSPQLGQYTPPLWSVHE